MTIDLKAIRERVAAGKAVRDSHTECCSCCSQAGETCDVCQPIERDEALALLELVEALTGALLMASMCNELRRQAKEEIDAALAIVGYPDVASRLAELARRARR